MIGKGLGWRSSVPVRPFLLLAILTIGRHLRCNQHAASGNLSGGNMPWLRPEGMRVCPFLKSICDD